MESRRLEINKSSHRRHVYDDRISSLPDELVVIILSFLTAKETVQTSILSKRWLDLWITSPVLDFRFPISRFPVSHSDTELERMECKKKVESVNLVLRRHKCHYLKTFKAVFHLKYALSSQKDIDGWLDFALARNVEILELNFVHSCRVSPPIDNYVFPDHYLQFYLLRGLKSLSLKGVYVDGVAVNFILLNCPFLERLELVSNSALSSLVISEPTLVLKHLQIKECPCEVFRISNIKLVSLDTDVVDFILSDLPMLVDLSLKGVRNTLNDYFSQLASYLPQLEALTLQASNLTKLTELPNLAQLTRLKRLVIVVGAWANESLIMLLSFMKYSHNFEEFVLELIWFDPGRYRCTMCGFESFDTSSSSTMLPSLKVFEFQGYLGRVCDSELIVHVVKNAPNLEKIIIKPDNILSDLHNRPVDILEEQIRSFALEQIGALRESECMPPHVDVVVC